MDEKLIEQARKLIALAEKDKAFDAVTKISLQSSASEIQRAENLAKLRRIETDHFLMYCYSYAQDIAQALIEAQAENARLREALEWYADRRNHRDKNKVTYRCEVDLDLGTRARTALKEKP